MPAALRSPSWHRPLNGGRWRQPRRKCCARRLPSLMCCSGTCNRRESAALGGFHLMCCSGTCKRSWTIVTRYMSRWPDTFNWEMSLSDSRKLITRSYICRWIWAVTSSLTQWSHTLHESVWPMDMVFFLELTLAEALKFTDRKSSLTGLSDNITKDSLNIKAHIHMLLEGLRELQGLQNFPETQH